jgi:ubiquinone/menaquinone biosynthesis C-methylase UbiE
VAASDGNERELVWAGDTGAAWLANADRLERQIEPVNDVLFAAAALQPGESVLDVGCGRGVTTRLAARQVFPGGRVTAVDISPNLIDAARHAAERSPGDAASIEWIVADAQRHSFAPAALDVVLSRFGVMFFDDPVAAFANLAAATRPGGRLTIAVWQPMDRSPLHGRVIEVVRAAVAERGVSLPEQAPLAGLYLFGVQEHVERILTDAGWRDVRFAPHTVAMYAGGKGATPDEAAALRLEVGPLEALLRDVAPDVRAHATDAVRAEFARHWDGTGVRLDGGIAIVTATR